MVKFAEFRSRPADIMDVIVEVGLMVPTDVEICAQLAADRDGMDLGVCSDPFRRLFDAASHVVLVARLEEQVVGYAKRHFLSRRSRVIVGLPKAGT